SFDFARPRCEDDRGTGDIRDQFVPAAWMTEGGRGPEVSDIGREWFVFAYVDVRWVWDYL
ncbi:MAG: hypothetical protein ACR2OU_19245, partial [Thermomicrobiales bacterium]